MTYHMIDVLIIYTSNLTPSSQNNNHQQLYFNVHNAWINNWQPIVLLIYYHNSLKIFLYRMMKMYAKTEFMTSLLHVFTTRQWKFDNSNSVELLSSLSIEDRDQFEFGMVNFDWKSYTKSYYYGIRRHILQEEMSNLDKAKSKNRKYVLTHVYEYNI